MSETAEARLKRLAMRSMRRGIKEMDMILGDYATATLAGMSDAELTLYDEMLAENDHDLYAWVCKRTAPPSRFAALITSISAHSGLR